MRGSDFRFPRPQLAIGGTASKVIMTDNLIVGPQNVTNSNGAKTAIANNLADD